MKKSTIYLPPPTSLAYALGLASEAITRVIEGGNLNEALLSCWRGHPSLPPSQRGAAQDLSYGALRRFGRGDFLLGQLLREPLKETQLRALLLATLYRLDARPKDSHTTVDQAVTAAAQIGHGNFKALANGVLRNYLRRREELEMNADADPVARYQHPQWWIDALCTAYPQDWQHILAAGNGRPPMTLRVNRRKGEVAACLAALTTAGINAHALEGEGILLDRPLPVDTLPGFAEGRLSVQDWGAQQAAHLLDVDAGMRVLDACAAPGGKMAHLLELADVELLALDADASRTTRIVENLDRLGLTSRATVKTADCRALDTWWDGRPFERILADVPCSASGVVRRHPDSKWLRRQQDIAGFARTQSEILDALWRVLAPGGKMLYSTCSLFAQENSMQVTAFTQRHTDALLLPTNPGSRIDSGSLDWQLAPQAEHDGFYYALLQKKPA